MSVPSGDQLSPEELEDALRQFASQEDADREKREAARAARQQREQEEEEAQLQEAIRLSQIEAAMDRPAPAPKPTTNNRLSQPRAEAVAAAAAQSPAAMLPPAAAASSAAGAAASSAAAAPAPLSRRATMPAGVATTATHRVPIPTRPAARKSVPPLPPPPASSLAALSPPAPAIPAAAYSPATGTASHAPKRPRSPPMAAAASVASSSFVARPIISRAATVPVATRAHSKFESDLAAAAAIEYSPLVELRRLHPRNPFKQQQLNQWFEQHSVAAPPAGPASSTAAAAAAAAAVALPSLSETELCGFIHHLHALVIRSPGTVIPADVVRAVWANLLAEDVSVHTANALYDPLLQLLVLSPASFLPTVSAWESWCRECLEFSTWLQQKDRDKRTGKLDQLQAQVLASPMLTDSNRHFAYPAAASASSSAAAAAPASSSGGAASSSSSIDALDAVHALSAEIARQREIHAQLMYQEKQEKHYSRWMLKLRLWTAAFQMDILVRQKGTKWFREHVQLVRDDDASSLEQMPGPQAHLHDPPPLLHALIVGAAPILSFAQSEAGADALARSTGPKLRSEAEEDSALDHSLEGFTRKGARGRGSRSGARGGGAASRGRGGRGRGRGRGGSLRSTLPHDDDDDDSWEPGTKRRRNGGSGSGSRSARGRDDDDHQDDEEMYSGASDIEFVGEGRGSGDGNDDDAMSADASFLVWWQSLLRWLGVSDGTTRSGAAAEEANRRTAATFRSKLALHTFQHTVQRFIALQQYVHSAQEQRRTRQQQREMAEEQGRPQPTDDEFPPLHCV